MTRKIVSLLFLVISLVFVFSPLTSCESDEAVNANGSLEKKLILSPASLEGELYTEYTFKARVTNVPASDVVFSWDFDEGQGFEEYPSGFDDLRKRTFYQPKVHMVRVRAIDYFTEKVLGYDSLRVDIRPPARSVTITPKAVDTTLTVLSTGVMRDSISFTFKTSTPDYFVRVEWDFGDGSPVRFTQIQHTIWHKFSANGSFTVVANAFDTAGAFLGSDTSHVTLRPLPLSFEDLAACRAISVFLSIDNSDSAFTHPLFRNPFAMKLQIKEDQINNKFFHNNLFTINYDTIGLNISRRNSTSGEVSPDLRTMKWIRVAVSDTGYLNKVEPVHGGVDYSYRLNDLKLLAVTSTKIVYRVGGLKLSDFAKEIKFRAGVLRLVPSGMLDNSNASRTPVEGLSGIFGLVVFER